MFVLIIGGSASGKSEFAENICVNLAKNSKKLYIATMEPFGEDAAFRISRHRKIRENKGFETLEKYRNLHEFNQKGYHSIMLECMSTLLANEFFTNESYKEKITSGVDEIIKNCENFILISNNIFDTCENYDEKTREYIKELAYFNQEFAKKADVLIEICCGIPIFWKGKEKIYGFCK